MCYSVCRQSRLLEIRMMFEYDDGVMVCTEHGTPAQKNQDGLWCRLCNTEAISEDDRIVENKRLEGQLRWDYT